MVGNLRLCGSAKRELDDTRRRLREALSQKPALYASSFGIFSPHQLQVSYWIAMTLASQHPLCC